MRLPFAALLCAATLASAACASSKPWNAGAGHPTAPNVVAGAEYGDWHPAPGYAWDEANNYSENSAVHWAPGSRHPRAHGLAAGFKEHSWVPAPGFVFANPQEPLDMSTRWVPGTPHPEYPHVVSGAEEDRWEPEIGFEWLGDGQDMRVKRSQ